LREPGEGGVTTYYCPNCWREVAPSSAVCPYCATGIREVLDRRTCEQKLIAAVARPEPGTSARAAWLLGYLRSAAAVRPLLDLLRRPPDVYTAAAAVEALGSIGDPAARPVLKELARNGSRPMRHSAKEALERMAQRRPEELR
jgi:HEAT repeat protein